MIERKEPPAPPKTFLDRVSDVVDRIVETFSPVRGVERLRYRAHQRELRSLSIRNSSSSGDDDRSELRGGAWLGSQLSPDSAQELDLEQTRRKCRELYRTDSIGGAVESRTNLVVSYGFTPQAKIKPKTGWATEAQAKVWNDELEEIFERVENGIGKNGVDSLWELYQLTETMHGVDGESLTIQHDRDDRERPIPLVLEVVDCERLETPPEKAGNPLVRFGVEHDSEGKIVAYHVRNSHPGDTRSTDLKYTRYPAERCMHVLRKWFPGQTRGYPWLKRAINRSRDIEDLDEASIAAAQVEACHAAFVTGAPGVKGSQAAQRNATKTKNGKRYQEIVPAMIHYLEDGQKVDFSAPTRTGGYDGLIEGQMRRSAGGMNWSYEMLAKNWGGLSFAAGRLTLTEIRLFVQSEQKLLSVQWLRRVWQRIVKESVICGACTIPGNVYNRGPWFFERHAWRAPAWPFSLTPLEEVEAKKLMVDENFVAADSVVGEYGGDREEVYASNEVARREQREKKIEPPDRQAQAGRLSPQQVEQNAA